MNDETISVRIPAEIKDALERKRRQMVRSVGAEVKTSAVIRAILVKDLRKKRKSRALEKNP